MFLLVYTWVFLGDTLEVKVPMSNHTFVLLRPFTSLKWLIGVYFVFVVATFIIWIVGSYMLGLSVFCSSTAPLLYKFTTFLVVSYWLGFFVVIGYSVKLFFGKDILAFIKEQTREHTNEEMEERIFRKVFNDYDKDREGWIPADDLGALIQALGVYVPDEELETLRKTLIDPDNFSRIKFNPLYAWFQKVTAEAEEADKKTKSRKGRGKDDDDDEDD